MTITPKQCILHQLHHISTDRLSILPKFTYFEESWRCQWEQLLSHLWARTDPGAGSPCHWDCAALPGTATDTSPEIWGGFGGQGLDQLQDQHHPGHASSRWAFTKTLQVAQSPREGLFLLPDKAPAKEQRFGQECNSLEFTSRCLDWPYKHGRKKIRSKMI